MSKIEHITQGNFWVFFKIFYSIVFLSKNPYPTLFIISKLYILDESLDAELLNLSEIAKEELSEPSSPTRKVCAIPEEAETSPPPTCEVCARIHSNKMRVSGGEYFINFEE